jgi:tripartite-type tricarboxylate transporter receptor subunit TctC
MLSFRPPKAFVPVLIGALFLILGITVSTTAAQDDFYRNKRIRVIVPYSAGGGYDLYTRTIARYWGRHIPGNPTFVVQNMPGGAGIVATNYLYGAAKRDGLTIGIMNREGPAQQVSGLPGVEFKSADFSWVGNANVEMTVVVIRADKGFKTLKDVINSPEPLVVGSTGAGSVNYNLPAVLNEILHTNFKIVTGYGGTADIRAAMERGEVDGIGGWSWSAVKTTGAHLLKERSVNVLAYYAPEPNKEMQDLGVPWVFDFPMSKEDRTYINTVFFANAIGRPFAAPPAIPQERLAILRKSFMETIKDPAFLREVNRLGLEVTDPFSGEKVEERVREYLSTDPKVLGRVARLLKGETSPQ